MNESRSILKLVLAPMLIAFAMVMCVDFFMAAAFAQSIEVPEVNALSELGKLILNWNVMGDLAKGILFVLIVVQVLKQAVDFKHKRLLVVVLSIIYGAGQMIIGGESASASVVAVMVSGGGAMALYEALKPILRTIPAFDFLKLSKND